LFYFCSKEVSLIGVIVNNSFQLFAVFLKDVSLIFYELTVHKIFACTGWINKEEVLWAAR